MTDDQQYLDNLDAMWAGLRQGLADHPYAVRLIADGTWALIIDHNGIGLIGRPGTDPTQALGNILTDQATEFLRHHANPEADQ